MAPTLVLSAKCPLNLSQRRMHMVLSSITFKLKRKKLRTAEEDEFERRRNSPCIVCEKDNDWDTL